MFALRENLHDGTVLVPEPTLFVTDASGTFAHVQEQLLKPPAWGGR